jgi:NAD(P)-dependent dehydrogenase (short-subunit alcohol dehydrogenase family)
MLPIAEARKQMEVNTIGAVHLAQLVVPGMRDAGWGRIINVSSLAGKMVLPMGGWYSASKHSLEALADALRLELTPFGIYTISILPGPVTTKFKENVQTPVKGVEDAPEVYRRIGEELRARTQERDKYAATAEDIARTILRAAEVSKPRARYYVNTQNRLSAITKWLLSDRAWDRFVAKFYKIDKLTK